MKNRYHIITIGCQMNKSDSERIAGYLDMFRYERTSKIKEADVVLITTCGVRQTAEDRIYGLVPQIKKDNKDTIIVLTGCLSNREDVKRRLKGNVDIWMPINELNLLAHKLKARDSKLCIDNYLKVKPKYSSGISAFVPIGNGCDNFCAYCVVPYARGREVYRDANDIIDEVRYLVDNGVKEIELIAQNVNSYKSDSSIITYMGDKKDKYDKLKEIDFSTLLKIINDIPGDFWIRFSTSHPKDINSKLIKTINQCHKVCEHIHLPVQAGDNTVLKRMNRKYSIEHYKKLISEIRKNIKGASITTDLIVGFPGETEKQFANSVKLFKEVKYDMAYIARYSPRPQTAAYKLKDDVSKEEKKRREDVIMKVLRETALKNNKKYLKKVVEVLVENKNKKGEYIGKTRTGKIVKIKGSRKNIIGDFVKVEINKVEDFGLHGKKVK